MSSPTPQIKIQKISILGRESIHCGIHLIPYIVHTILSTLPSSTYVLCTDTIVAAHHLHAFSLAFNNNNTDTEAEVQQDKKNEGRRFLTFLLEPGEGSKSREGKASVEDFLLQNKCTRDTVLLALGGGVIGDLVGFVAATFMRGIRFVQIPTTLLAMVDSSIGGKTAIDTPHGKNLIGAFWQPEYVFVDPAFLTTLPEREVRNGLAEVIKTAAIWDEEEFALLESRAEEVLSSVSSSSVPSASSSLLLLLQHIIAASISVKAHIVTIDERETGLRNLVNFGHTIGHAIEAVLTPSLLHGECVAVGMVLEAEVARQRGVLSQVAVGRLTRVLRNYGLPTSLSDPRIARLERAREMSVERLLDVMAVDKKNKGREKKVVLLSRIGKTYEEKASAVDDDVIRRALCDAVRVIPPSLSVSSGSGELKRKVEMTTPGSKSISNRALLLAALGRGQCRLRNLLHSDDTQVMMNALLDLRGARFAWEDGGETVLVHGGGGVLRPPEAGKEVYLGNAGTAARFLTSVCTLVTPEEEGEKGKERPTVITGNARMHQRPIAPLVSALTSAGAHITYLSSPGCLPLSILPSHPLRGGRIQLAASVSSQYVSSILLCAPYAAGEEPVTLELVGGEVISQPYIDMTLKMMKDFGIDVVRHTAAPSSNPSSEQPKFLDVYTIPKGCYVNPGEYAIESDASSATYPLALAAALGTECVLGNIGRESLQGDARFAREVLEPMGCVVVQGEGETRVVGPAPAPAPARLFRSPSPSQFDGNEGQGAMGLGLRALGEVDMESMTDAFLTASVLAAIATRAPIEGRRLDDGSPENTTRILGIKNQRVKECNRIRAMIDELAKFGVATKELDDGLEIYGKPIGELRENVRVHCYDDHRVAMAFSVLSALVPGTVIEEKRCVEKTWPSWWDDLENKIGLKVEGVELSPLAKSDESSRTQTDTDTDTGTEPDPNASILIIGMRGSGKTHIGSLAAQILDYTFLDADAVFESQHNTSVRSFVHSHGWPAFRAVELELLRFLVSEHPKRYVISLGGGIVETEEARAVLGEYGRRGRGRVVCVKREVEEVVRYLGEEKERPAYGESVQEVYGRREPWFESCAGYEFVNYTVGSTSTGEGEGYRKEVERFFKHITGVKTNYVSNVGSEAERRSYFLSLTYPDLTPALPYISTLSTGADALELRVDLLRSPSSPSTDTGDSYIPPTEYVLEQLAALRRATTLPIVFTVRTRGQGGAFPDGAEDEAFALFEIARRTGCEYIDIELCWNAQRIREFRRNKGTSRVIASWHDWSGAMKWDVEAGSEVRVKYELAREFGDVIKIVGKATSVDDNFALRSFVVKIEEEERKGGRVPKPFIALNTGSAGQLSRILNPTLSPITHARMGVSAAPGQLEFVQIQRALHLLGLLPKRQFYLLGSPISSSPSPTLHNSAFKALGLPHEYGLFETDMVNEAVRELVSREEFGGASVTIPLKTKIMDVLDELSDEAREIGAVNTIIVSSSSSSSPENGGKKRILRGDNTDWLGIRRCILNQLSRHVRSSSTRRNIGLVIGAGGTARAALYALHSLGLSTIYTYNRTRSAAEALRASFPHDYGIEILEDLERFPGGKPTIVVSTVPGSVTTTTTATLSQDREGERMYLPRNIFGAEGGVVVDMAYKPAETPLLALASSVSTTGAGGGEGGGGGWKIVRGVDVLLEQGFAQFELWMGRRCPREEVVQCVWDMYNSHSQA